MVVALLIAIWNHLYIPPICWVLYALEIIGRILNHWLKD